MIGDQILSDTIWHDGKHKRRLLLPIKWADSILIDSIEEYGTDAVHISLTYRMVTSVAYLKKHNCLEATRSEAA